MLIKISICELLGAINLKLTHLKSGANRIKGYIRWEDK